MVDSLDLAVVEKGRRVIDVAFLVDEADDRRDAFGGLRDQLQLGEVVAHEGRFQKQVFGRVPGDYQLGEADDVRLRLAPALDPFDDKLSIAGQVADGGVDLRERNPHVSIVAWSALRHRRAG